MSKSRSSKLFIITLAFVFLAAGPALAEESYQSEISAIWANGDSDNVDQNVYALIGEIYFSPVNTDDYPLAEASFLERVGSVGVLISKSDFDFNDPSFPIEYSGDGRSVGLEINYTRPDIPFWFQAGYVNSDSEYDPPISLDMEADHYFVGAGYFLMDDMLAAINYEQSDFNVSYGFASFDQTEKRYGVNVKKVWELQNNTAYNLLVGFNLIEDESSTQTYDDWEFSVSGDYYLTRLISIGAGLEIYRGDQESREGNEYTLRNKTFFNRHIGIELSYSRFDADNSFGENSDDILFSVIGLF